MAVSEERAVRRTCKSKAAKRHLRKGSGASSSSDAEENCDGRPDPGADTVGAAGSCDTTVETMELEGKASLAESGHRESCDLGMAADSDAKLGPSMVVSEDLSAAEGDVGDLPLGEDVTAEKPATFKSDFPSSDKGIVETETVLSAKPVSGETGAKDWNVASGSLTIEYDPIIKGDLKLLKGQRRTDTMRELADLKKELQETEAHIKSLLTVLEPWKELSTKVSQLLKENAPMGSDGSPAAPNTTDISLVLGQNQNILLQKEKLSVCVNAAPFSQQVNHANTAVQPSSTHANEHPSSMHTNEQPSSTHANEQPSSTHANEQPSSMHTNEQPSRTLANGSFPMSVQLCSLQLCVQMYNPQVRFVARNLIKQILGFIPEDVYVLLSFTHTEFDFSFKLPLGLDEFWRRYNLKKGAKEWQHFKVIPVSKPELKNVTIIMKNESVPPEDLIWLRRQCTGLSPLVKIYDEEDFWVGGYKVQVKLNTESYSQKHLPSSFLLVKIGICCNFCLKTGHAYTNCPEAWCNVKKSCPNLEEQMREEMTESVPVIQEKGVLRWKVTDIPPRNFCFRWLKTEDLDKIEEEREQRKNNVQHTSRTKSKKDEDDLSLDLESLDEGESMETGEDLNLGPRVQVKRTGRAAIRGGQGDKRTRPGHEGGPGSAAFFEDPGPPYERPSRTSCLLHCRMRKCRKAEADAPKRPEVTEKAEVTKRRKDPKSRKQPKPKS
ncbi:hypothetical protein XELAEV_18003672mg [Xenopus laevis]|nr:hypothetical protein XELAEV_18003672mg [Xenopus laevis]